MFSYCTREDLESAWSTTAVLRAADDDEDGSLSPAEEAFIVKAIERAAGTMNARLAERYRLAELLGNAWCRATNAVLAAHALAVRRGNPAPPHLETERQSLLADLEEIRAGRMRIPEAPASHEMIPTVTNFTTDLRRRRAKIRRVPETSSGAPPPASRRSFPETD